ncbi:flavin-dependent monooxygenase [Sphingomonas histidinilytica]|uniref:acyl-CoA dehydrogenase family protein n=1 Tax=Rhizorhabdus histidinilytica TaxID=439228 RepID=UPI001ADC1074|nr:acyl-CoA dehydrogenase family protein [Rhizorhabdus histidinilytica]MBO9380587.1 flavin-dependent monooxygenase [Rhizorhabdus histidinilytica]
MDAKEQVKPEPSDRTAALETLLSAARARRDEFNANQQISADVVEMMKAAGVYRAMVAKRFGGDEKSPAEFLRLIETISQADGSTGWVASFGFSAVYLSALPIETLEAMYANGPDVVFAGGIFPPQKAVPVEGGLEVSGRWSWGSGCTGAEVIGVGIKVEGGGPTGGLPLIAVTPAKNVQIVPNWDVIGMRGTGSHDMVLDKVVVPEAWTFVRGGKSSLDTPLYRYPSMPLAAQVLAVVGLGIARSALDQMTALAGGRTSITGQPTLADRPYVQTDIAKAEAALRSARAFFYEITEEAYATLVAGDELSVETRALLRLASTNAARVGADITLDIYRMAGTTGVFANHWIAQLMQDSQVIPQHAFLADTTWQNAGKVLLGLESPPGYP